MSIRPILLFDFDGTIALGNGPVLSYARHVAARLDDPDAFLDDVRAALAAGAADARDGYDAVRIAAERADAKADDLGRAYLDSRARLATEDAEITVPAGLAAFLAEVDAERILVTNAPGIRLDEALEVLGLAGLFDRIVTDAGKPDGLTTLLDELPAGSRILSIGDIWHNDLAPVHERGHATALVGVFAEPDAAPTFRAAAFADLLPEIRDWLRAPHDLTDAPTRTHTHTEG